MYEHQRCMNCGAGLKGPYCHFCGQRDDDFRRPFLALGNEFIGDVFAFDSRIFRSVPPFLFVPGMLTRSFMKGKRGKYVSPLRLYFVLTLVFFAVLAATDVAIFKIRVDADRLEKLGTSLSGDGPSANLRIGPDGAMEVGLGEPAKPEEGAKELGEFVEETKKTAQDQARALRRKAGAASSAEGDTPAETASRPEEGAAADAQAIKQTADAAARQAALSAEELERRLTDEIRREGFPIHVAFFSRIEEDENFQGLPVGWKEDISRQIDELEGTEEDKQQFRRAVAAVELALTNPRAFNQIFNTWIPRILIIVVPLFALLTSFLYGRQKRLPRRVYYIDHLVFSIYFHSFIFLLMLLLVLKAEWIGNVWSGSLTAQLFFLVIAAYLFIGMKQAFGQGYIKTTVKFVFLYSVYFVTLACALLTLLVMGVLSLPVAT